MRKRCDWRGRRWRLRGGLRHRLVFLALLELGLRLEEHSLEGSSLEGGFLEGGTLESGLLEASR